MINLIVDKSKEVAHALHWLQRKYLQLLQSQTIMSQQMRQQLKLCKKTTLGHFKQMVWGIVMLCCVVKDIHSSAYFFKGNSFRAIT